MTAKPPKEPKPQKLKPTPKKLTKEKNPKASEPKAPKTQSTKEKQVYNSATVLEIYHNNQEVGDEEIVPTPQKKAKKDVGFPEFKTLLVFSQSLFKSFVIPDTYIFTALLQGDIQFVILKQSQGKFLLFVVTKFLSCFRYAFTWRTTHSTEVTSFSICY